MQQELLELLEKGSTREEVMNHFNWTESQFHWYFKKFLPEKSIKHYSKHVNHKYFQKLNNGKKCYLLGFLLADGCITSQKKSGELNCFSIALKESDKVILELFKQEISKDLNIQLYENSDGYKVCKIQWTSESMVKDLLKYVTHLHRKSFNTEMDINLDLIPDEYFGDFLRGLMDGDGTIKNSSPRIEILFSSEKIANKIKNKLKTLFPNYLNVRISKDEYYSKENDEKRNIPIYRLFISSGEKGLNDYFLIQNMLFYLNVFYYFLYNDSKFFLPRKKARFIEYRANFLNKIGLESSVEHRE